MKERSFFIQVIFAVLVVLGFCTSASLANELPIYDLKSSAISNSIIAVKAAQLKVGQSIKFSTNNLISTLNKTGDSLAWGNTGVWDAQRGIATWIGKTANTSRYRRIEYNEKTNSWSESKNLHQELIEAKFGHGYDGNAIDPETGDLYFRLTASNRPVNVYHWKKSTDSWTRIDAPRPAPCCEAIEWWNDRGLVYSDSLGVDLWDGSSWTKLASRGSVKDIGYHSIGEYQPNGDVYVFGGGNAGGGKKLYKLDRENSLTVLPSAPFRLGSGATTQGILVQDPASDKFIAWQRGGPEWAELDPLKESWRNLSVSSGDPNLPQDGTPNLSYPLTIAIPIHQYGVIMFVSQYPGMKSNGVWLYKHSSLQKISTSKPLFSFDLVTKVAGEVPFTAGLSFKNGDVPELPRLDLSRYQIDVKRRWNDGSVKHAIVSGVFNAVAGEPFSIKVFGDGTAPKGVSLTSADILAAAPRASVQLGSYGTVQLSDLLKNPVRTWLTGPEMVEAHYYNTVSVNPHLTVKFHVRLYRGGEVFIRTIIENGDLNRNRGEDLFYLPHVAIDGKVIFDNNGQTLEHIEHQRWDVTGWINIRDPDIEIIMDTDYLMASKLVPNYWKKEPSRASLDGLAQSYEPLQNCDWTRKMFAAGYQSQIGLLPLWDALYLNSAGDPSAYRSVIANARAINSYPIVWPDPKLNEPIIISNYPTYTVFGPKGGGATSWNAGGLNWDIAHHGSAGYLAYLLTGDYYFLETLQYQATLCYLFTISTRGGGTERLIKPVQTRGLAWATRTYGQLAGIAPLNSLTNDIIAMLDFSAAHWCEVVEQPGMNQLGYIYTYNPGAYSAPNGGLAVAPWMLNFWIQVNGYISDLEYSAEMTDFNFVRDHMYKGVVGLLGPNGEDYYCYTKAGAYTITVADNITGDPTQWYDSWGDVWTSTTGEPNLNCGTSLSGYVGAAAKTTYLGNLLPALAYAVEDGAPGAIEALQRLQSADNWSGIETGGWEDVPIWGIMPRTVGAGDRD
jgi:hypothetical protein